MSAQLESLLSRETRTACARQDLSLSDRLKQEERERAAAKGLLRQLFAAAVRRGDVAAPALFARRRPSTGAVRTVASVIEDALGNREAFMPRAMRILVNAANGKGTQRDAQQLLEEAGAVWAENEAEFA